MAQKDVQTTTRSLLGPARRTKVKKTKKKKAGSSISAHTVVDDSVEHDISHIYSSINKFARRKRTFERKHSRQSRVHGALSKAKIHIQNFRPLFPWQSWETNQTKFHRPIESSSSIVRWTSHRSNDNLPIAVSWPWTVKRTDRYRQTDIITAAEESSQLCFYGCFHRRRCLRETIVPLRFNNDRRIV